MPANLTDLLKVLGKLGGVGVTLALIMFTYLHMRGYSDSASWEIATVTVFVAGVANAIPSPIGNQPPPTAGGTQ